MTTLQEHLDELDPTAPIRNLCTELAKRTAIESDITKDYASLRPAMSGAIAVFAHRNRVSIGLPPEQSSDVVSRFPGRRKRRRARRRTCT